MRQRILSSIFVLLLAALGCEANTPPEPRVVDLTATDGVHLKATYFAAGKPGPGVILLHQCNQQRKSWDDLAGRLAIAGINVLTLDYRGYGESEGPRALELSNEDRTRMITEQWPGDIDTAFQYLSSQTGVTKNVMGAAGASCGVNQSIQLARRHAEVKSLVLLSGNTDGNGRKFLQASAGLPIFFSAADDDEGAVDLMQWLYAVAPNPGNQFAHYATGGHGTVMFREHKELPETIVNWFVTTLIKTPAKAPAAKKALAVDSERANILRLLDEPGGADEVAQKLAEARKRDPKSTLFSELIVNVIGYEHIQSGDTKGAVEILKLNLTAYPDSANVYDSLSDAYLAAGQKDLAREYAQKTLEKLATDSTADGDRKKLIRDSAEQKLKQLGEKQ
jgi:dienelactone hydrolase